MVRIPVVSGRAPGASGRYVLGVGVPVCRSSFFQRTWYPGLVCQSPSWTFHIHVAHRWLVVGAIAFFWSVFRRCGPGYNVIGPGMHGQIHWSSSCSCLAEAVATTISFSSGTPGGEVCAHAVIACEWERRSVISESLPRLSDFGGLPMRWWVWGCSRGVLGGPLTSVSWSSR